MLLNENQLFGSLAGSDLQAINSTIQYYFGKAIYSKKTLTLFKLIFEKKQAQLSTSLTYTGSGYLIK